VLFTYIVVPFLLPVLAAHGRIPRRLHKNLEGPVDSSTIVRVVAGCMFLVVLAFGIVYINSLGRLLSKCAPSSRTMQPGRVWLLLIPVFGIIWGFLVVSALGKSLGNEFRLRGIASTESEPGKTLGMAMCVCQACGIVPFLNFLALPAALVLWTMYWMKTAGYSRMLDQDAIMTRVTNTLQGI
jgi:hypothetical protein